MLFRYFFHTLAGALAPFHIGRRPCAVSYFVLTLGRRPGAVSYFFDTFSILWPAPWGRFILFSYLHFSSARLSYFVSYLIRQLLRRPYFKSYFSYFLGKDSFHGPVSGNGRPAGPNVRRVRRNNPARRSHEPCERPFTPHQRNSK